MYAYAFQASLYCQDCGEDIVRGLRALGVEDTGDSGDFPQGPYADGGGEADSPQHCDNGARCLAAEIIGGCRVGSFLGNPLTSDGEDYVRKLYSENSNSPVARFWAGRYGLLNTED